MNLRSVEDWETAIAETISTEDMLSWIGEVLDAHISDCGDPARILAAVLWNAKALSRACNFSRKLSPEQRQLFIEQADTIMDLIRGLWGKDKVLMKKLDAALIASTDYYKRFGWPSPIWDMFEFLGALTRIRRET